MEIFVINRVFKFRDLWYNCFMVRAGSSAG